MSGKYPELEMEWILVKPKIETLCPCAPGRHIRLNKASTISIASTAPAVEAIKDFGQAMETAFVNFKVAFNG